MANQHGHFLNVIDVGSAKTCALVAEITENGLRYRGHGVAESRGTRKGVIVDLEKAVSSIQKAVESAEDRAGAPVEHALVGVAGSHVRGINTHGGITFGNRPREIAREEIRMAVDKARAISLPADREILHLLPQEFILDEQSGVHDPLGMMAMRLEVRVHMVTAGSSATQNVVTAVNRAGVHVDDTVFEPLACADAVLRADERELGVCLMDLGAGSTSLIVFQEGAVIHTAVIPIGGDHFTSDLSVGLCTPLAEAEKIKATLVELRALRHEAQPQGIKTFGSTFKNPEDPRADGRSAGLLLAEAGCGGLAIGGARFAPKHANFIENTGAATTADVLAVMAEGRRRVLERFGVELEPEVQTLGEVRFPWL